MKPGRGARPRASAILATALALAGAAASSRAAASPSRPYDAPKLEAPAPLPAVPPEYLRHEEQGIRFAYHPSTRDRIRAAMTAAPAIRDELERELGRPVLGDVEIRIAAVPAEMPRLAPVPLPSYAPAVALSKARLVVMSAASPVSLEPPDLGAELRHALAHLALDDALDHRDVPRWLHEGFAIRFSGQGALRRGPVLALAAATGKPFRLDLLGPDLPAEIPAGSLAAAQAADFVRYLTRQGGDRGMSRLVARMRDGDAFEPALAAAAGAPVVELEEAWASDVRRRFVYGPALGLGLLAGAGAWLLRRRLRRRAPRPAAETPPRARPRGPSLPRPRPAAAPRDRGLPIIPSGPARDASVPKIEHGGRWHTLH